MLNLEEERLFKDALAAAQLEALPTDDADEIAQFLGMGPFVELCRNALRGDTQPRQRLSHLSRVARACRAARKDLKMPYAAFDRLDMARTRDARAFGRTFKAAVDGDQQSKTVIRSWLSPAGDPPEARAAVHPTPVPPPPTAPPPPRAAEKPPQQPVAVAKEDRSPIPTATPRPAQTTQPSQRSAPAAPPASHRNVHPLRPASVETPRDTASDAPAREYDQVEVYGRDRSGATALQAENCPTKKNRNVTTINLSIGRAKQGRTQDGVDWQNKLIVMLTGGELLLVFAVLTKLLGSFRTAGHGPANDKWVEVSEVTDPQWAGQVRITIAQGKGRQADIRSVGIGCKDMPFVVDVFTRAGLSQFPSAGNFTGLLAMARRSADLYEKSTAAEQLRKPREAVAS
jgi:hypothetical protein